MQDGKGGHQAQRRVACTCHLMMYARSEALLVQWGSEALLVQWGSEALL